MSAPEHGRRLRPELPPLPRRMETLPVRRGYPVPWFVHWPPGVETPDFRVADGEKRVRSARERLCWVCGHGIAGPHAAFVIGPMCAVNRISSDPWCCIECAGWSAVACPFLARPNMARRGGMPEGVEDAPGLAIKRNPGVALVWITRRVEILRFDDGGFLFGIGEPTRVTCFAEGREAMPDEVRASLVSGLPALREAAELEGPDALLALAGMVGKAERILGLQ